MIGTIPGVITGIDRDNQRVRALLEDGQDIDAYYLGGAPPWPLAGAMFTDEPASLCLGPIGDRRTLFHDDFMWGFAPTATRWDGDGNWNGVIAGSGSITDFDDPGQGGAGAVALTAPAASEARIRKLAAAVNLPDDGAALWMRARVAGNNALVSSGLGTARVGLGTLGVITSTTAAGDHGVYASYGTGNPWQLTALEDPTATVVVAGGDTPAVAPAAWDWIDLVVVADAWAALWVNGSGPWAVTANLGSAGSAAVTPFVTVDSDSGTCVLYADLVAVDLVNPVNDPTDYALGLQTTGIGG